MLLNNNWCVLSLDIVRNWLNSAAGRRLMTLFGVRRISFLFRSTCNWLIVSVDCERLQHSLDAHVPRLSILLPDSSNYS